MVPGITIAISPGMAGQNEITLQAMPDEKIISYVKPSFCPKSPLFLRKLVRFNDPPDQARGNSFSRRFQGGNSVGMITDFGGKCFHAPIGELPNKTFQPIAGSRLSKSF